MTHLCDLFPPEFRYQCDPYCAAGCGQVPGVPGHGDSAENGSLQRARIMRDRAHGGHVPVPHHIPLELIEDPDQRPYIWDLPESCT